MYTTMVSTKRDLNDRYEPDGKRRKGPEMNERIVIMPWLTRHAIDYFGGLTSVPDPQHDMLVALFSEQQIHTNTAQQAGCEHPTGQLIPEEQPDEEILRTVYQELQRRERRRSRWIQTIWPYVFVSIQEPDEDFQEAHAWNLVEAGKALSKLRHLLPVSRLCEIRTFTMCMSSDHSTFEMRAHGVKTSRSELKFFL